MKEAPRQDAVGAGYKKAEVGVIPEDWEVYPIGKLASFASGNGISVSSLSPQSFDAPYPVYGGNGIAGYTAKPLVKTPTVIVGRVGQKCGEVYLSTSPSWITDNALYPRTIFKDIDILFFAFALKAADLNNVKNKNDLPLVTQVILHSVQIPLPPTIAEQAAIATALFDTDALIQSLEKLIAKKRAIKQGAMQELLTGKRRLPGFEGKKGYKKTEVGIIPEDWKVVRMGDVGQTFIGLTYSPKDVAEHGTIVLRSSNVQNGKLAYEDNVFVQMDLPPRVMVEEGDILICVRNGSRQLIGKCVLIDKSANGAAFGAFMSLYRSTHSPFIFRQFQSAIIQRQINETLGATINQIISKIWRVSLYVYQKIRLRKRPSLKSYPTWTPNSLPSKPNFPNTAPSSRA